MHLPSPYTSPPRIEAFALRRGKVRDIYQTGSDRLVIVASDRISAFDAVLSPGIPGKGIVLNQLSNFWFALLADVVPNHLLATELGRFPEPFSTCSELEGRACLVRPLRVVPVECVVRGYLVGSGWKEYRSQGSVCGIALPAGLTLAEQLGEPIFTPSTKADVGHDENISFDDVVALVGGGVAERLRAHSISLYRRAAAYAEARGIIIADTKFEFGLDESGAIVWADEALTPDSSRFWPVAEYRTGANPPSFDKQFVRDWLEASGWNKQPPAPTLPDGVVEGTLERYLEAFRRLTGRELSL
jgi:phosphoribosylaminoimidazole-succinocarboxamide synthase